MRQEQRSTETAAKNGHGTFLPPPEMKTRATQLDAMARKARQAKTDRIMARKLELLDDEETVPSPGFTMLMVGQKPGTRGCQGRVGSLTLY